MSLRFPLTDSRPRAPSPGTSPDTWSPRVADPAPVASSKGLNLYFSTIDVEMHGVGAGLGYGIWRGVAVSGNVHLVDWVLDHARAHVIVEIVAVFGVDFVVCGAISPETGLPRDQLAEATTYNLLDPDPVHDPIDGTWRVYVGCAPDAASKPKPMMLILGADADGDSSWVDAWCESGDAQDNGDALDGDAEQDDAALAQAALPYWLTPGPVSDLVHGAFAGVTVISGMPCDGDCGAPAGVTAPRTAAGRRPPARRATSSSCGCA